MEDTKRSSARRQAEDRFAALARRDADVRAYQQKQWDAEAAKIARLRALRLARDAELEAQAREAAASKPARGRRSGPSASAAKASRKDTAG